MGGCQNYGRCLGTLNIRWRILVRTQKGTIILTTTHMSLNGPEFVLMGFNGPPWFQAVLENLRGVPLWVAIEASSQIRPISQSAPGHCELWGLYIGLNNLNRVLGPIVL